MCCTVYFRFQISKALLFSYIHPFALPVVWHRVTQVSHQPSLVPGPEGRLRCCTILLVQTAPQRGPNASGRCRSPPQQEHTVLRLLYQPVKKVTSQWCSVKKTKKKILPSCQISKDIGEKKKILILQSHLSWLEKGNRHFFPTIPRSHRQISPHELQLQETIKTFYDTHLSLGLYLYTTLY